MSDVKVTVGGAIEDEAARRFVDAWHRVEQGEPVEARHVAFESWDALAKSLGRDYSNVHANVQALTSARPDTLSLAPWPPPGETVRVIGANQCQSVA